MAKSLGSQSQLDLDVCYRIYQLSGPFLCYSTLSKQQLNVHSIVQIMQDVRGRNDLWSAKLHKFALNGPEVILPPSNALVTTNSTELKSG